MRFWSACVKDRITNFNPPQKDFWGYLGNACIDTYVKVFKDEIKIINRNEVMPELSIGINSPNTYVNYYFLQNKHLKDIEINMMLLHNSWTPDFYKKLSLEELLQIDCTMSNVLCEVLEIKRNTKKLVRIQAK